MNIRFTTVQSLADVEKILQLQAANLPGQLDPDTLRSQGFVTVRHEPDVLRRMNEVYPSVIALDGDVLAGYCLVMLRDFARDVPVLIPFFERLEQLNWNGIPLSEQRWFAMGQVCVAAPYRGQGVFDGLYGKLEEVCRDNFDFVVTEVAARNTRSLRAHERVGFETILVYPDVGAGETWHVIARKFR
ncbi:MAG: GNAT family N-acetyltransferase [Bacteroidetes bacterium]|nr:MAG: GNAT family N-acetyltransferase [Bacteroidota bacterium]